MNGEGAEGGSAAAANAGSHIELSAAEHGAAGECGAPQPAQQAPMASAKPLLVSFAADVEAPPTPGASREVGDEEQVPDLDYYRSILSRRQRTSLRSLLAIQQDGDDAPGSPGSGRRSRGELTPSGYAFGMWEGVFARCLTSIWGVIMFLRLAWVVGNAGIWQATLIMLGSTMVTTMTTVSLSAVCTNGDIKGGGAYYLISRSLGAEMGGVIGVTLFIASAVSTSMYLVGFGEAAAALLPEPWVNEDWDMRFFALIGLCGMMCIAFVGANLEVYTQKGLLVVMSLALLSFFIGTLVHKRNEDKGITGAGSSSFADNWSPNYDEGESWITVFAVFFPAVTGIMAGANISGDLKDPQKAIPMGTLLAIVVSTTVYLMMAFAFGGSFDRATLKDITSGDIAAVEIALVPALVYAGIFASTLSSALGLLIGAPRILLALARDNIFPVLKPFSVGHGEWDEPVRGYILTFAITAVCILTADLNTIAPLTTNFFLICYAAINYACAAATWSKSPGWRPTYMYYDPRGAAFAAAACIVVMIIIDWITAGVTIMFCFVLFKYIQFKSPDINWGSATQAARHLQAVQALYRLEGTPEHVKNFRPQYLLLVKAMEDRPGLIRFMDGLSEGQGALIVANVVVGDYSEKYEEQARLKRSLWLVQNRIAGFMEAVVAPSFLFGVEAMLQLSGLGKLRPNTMVLGYKDRWRSCSREEISEYLRVIRSGFTAELGVGILRGLDDFTNEAPEPGSTIDVWWLSEDGGLTILLPHLLQKHAHWKHCQLRVFTLATDQSLTDEQIRMSQLLRKLRIRAEVQVIRTSGDPPSEESRAKYLELFDEPPSDPFSDRAEFYLRIGELLLEHSAAAALAVVSLPIPRFDLDDFKYMAFLEVLSNFGAKCMLLRGNQESVLTFQT